jgi:hypothetical protein
MSLFAVDLDAKKTPSGGKNMMNFSETFNPLAIATANATKAARAVSVPL